MYTKVRYLLENNNITVMIVATIMILIAVSIQLYPVKAQTGEQPIIVEGTGATYASSIIAVAGVALAIIGIVKEVMKSRFLEGKIDEKTKEQIDLAEVMMTKLVQKSEVMKQFADTIYFLLLPEEAKKIADAYAIKISNLNNTLERDMRALNDLKELIARFQSGEITKERAARLAKDIIANSQTPIFTAHPEQAHEVTGPEPVKKAARALLE